MRENSLAAPVQKPVKLGSVFFDRADAHTWNGEEFGRSSRSFGRDRFQCLIGEDAKSRNAAAFGFGKTPGAKGGLDS